MVDNNSSRQSSGVNARHKPVPTKFPKHLGMIVGIVISLFLGWVVFKRMEWQEIKRILDGIQVMQLAFTAGLIVAGQLLRVWRWRYIMEEDNAKKRKFRPFFSSMVLGGIVNSLSPVRLGELVRCFLLSSELKDVRTVYILATVTLEKILDLSVLLLVFQLVIFNEVIPPELSVSYSWLPMAWIVLGIVSLVTAFIWRDQVKAGLQSGLERLLSPQLQQKLMYLVFTFLSGMRLIVGWQKGITLMVVTFLIWALDAATIWGFAWAIDVPFSPFHALAMSAIMSLSFILPSSPGFVGTYDYFSMTGLVFFGLGEQEALTLTLVMHSALLVTTLTFGLLGLWIIKNQSEAHFLELIRNPNSWITGRKINEKGNY
ncbi:MAG: flippase-like domain-containing protein [Magnetococcales bacterium]|nr:flippase-like domain-containing protein [Magnetococcales bacterium]